MKFRALIFLSLFTINSHIQPIHPNWTIAGTAISIPFGAALGYIPASYHTNNMFLKSLAALTGAGIIGTGMYYFLYNLTPQGRYERACNLINDYSNDKLAIHPFASYEELKTYLKKVYLNDWYLVSGKIQLGFIRSLLTSAFNLLQKAQTEQSNNVAFVAACNQQKEKIHAMVKNIDLLLSLVDSNSQEYYNQRRLYDADLERSQREARHQSKKWEKRIERWNREAQKEKELKERSKYQAEKIRLLSSK